MDDVTETFKPVNLTNAGSDIKLTDIRSAENITPQLFLALLKVDTLLLQLINHEHLPKSFDYQVYPLERSHRLAIGINITKFVVGPLEDSEGNKVFEEVVADVLALISQELYPLSIALGLPISVNY